MMRTRDALSKFLEALAQPQNYDVVWDAAKGELTVRPLPAAQAPQEASSRRRRSSQPDAAHPLA